MKFRYVGENEEMKVFGHDFSNGATPDVTDESVIRKLTGNSHFEVIKGFSRKDANELLIQVREAGTIEALEKLAENEDRIQVLDAIEKKKAELAGEP
jgi:Mg/Co/Ni transporter MgtE